MPLILLLLFAFQLSAEIIPSPLTGFTHTQTLSPDTNQKHGLLLNSNASGVSSPVVADLDGDLSNGLEVVVVSQLAKVTAVSATGNILWEQSLPNAGCATFDLIYSSPAVAKLSKNSVPTVVVGYGGLRTKACGGGVFAMRGDTGAKIWNFDLKNFARRNKFFAISHAAFSTPALADVNGDGELEVGFGALDRNVYLLSSKGKLIWYYQAADTVFSSPTFYNIDSDPALEMLIGTDITGNSKIKPATFDGGNVYALKANNRQKKKYTFRSPEIVKWLTPLDQVVQSSPVIADVLSSNPGKEVIVGSGCFFPQNSNNKRGKWIKILRVSDGKVLQTLNTPTCLSSTVAIADLEGDGVNEIVATINGTTNFGGAGAGLLAAWKADNQDPYWIVEPRSQGGNDSYLGNIQSPVIADLDGNGSLEIAISNTAGIGIYSAVDGNQLTCESRNCSDHLNLPTFSTLKATPAIADINLDGKLDLVIAGRQPAARKQAIYAWTNFSEVLTSEVGPHPAYSLPWGQFKNNATRNAVASVLE